jgi:flagella basal body P-ring formation protein FlgA
VKDRLPSRCPPPPARDRPLARGPSAVPAAAAPAEASRSGPGRLSCLLALGLAAHLLAGGPARAELPPDAMARALVLARDAAAALAPEGARVLVTPAPLDPRLRLAPCARVEPYLAGGQPVWGRTRVGMRCAAGANWRVFLPLQVQVLAPAPALRVALPAGARLSEDQFEMAEVDWGATPAPPARTVSELAGRTLARPVAAGQAVRSTDLQPRQWFASGTPVRVLAQGPGYAISTEGTALNPGLEGQAVRVRTHNGRILVGRAVGEGRVELRL